MRSYSVLSDHDFELFVADLLGTEQGVRFEVFARGRDGGIDLRHVSDGRVDVVQCKHFQRSTYAQLKAMVRHEATRLATLDKQPERYRLVTSMPLTPDRKTELAGLLTPWVTGPHEILGADDLETRLDAHPDVERRHVKLWLSGVAMLDARIHSAIWERSTQLRHDVAESLPRYVETGTFVEAKRRLGAERVVVVSGPPGVGKTTLAQMLLADASSDGYEVVEISRDVEEANAVLDVMRPQVFYYDDFLGATFLQDRLAKNEDRRLAAFIRRVRRSQNTLFVLTTREHILRQAMQWYDALEAAEVPMRRLLLEVEQYSRYERARIFYNHVWHAAWMGAAVRQALRRDDSYLRIIDHKNYNPRLIEHITSSTARHEVESGSDFVTFALEALDNPQRVWEKAFERQLDDHGRCALIALVTLPRPTPVDDLHAAYKSIAVARGIVPSAERFHDALKSLDDSFARSEADHDRVFVDVHDPSVEDFVGGWLHARPAVAATVVDGAVRWGQLEWLERRLTGHLKAPAAEHDLRYEYTMSLARAVPRLWESASGVWVPSFGTNRRRVQYARSEAERFVLLATLLGSSAVCRETLGGWFTARLRDALARWKVELDVDVAPLVDLVREVAQPSHPGTDLMPLVRDVMLSHVVSTYEWQFVDSLRATVPEAFPPDVNRAAIDACAGWAREMFTGRLDELGDEDEVWEVWLTATQFGADVDTRLYDRARRNLTPRPPRPGNPVVTLPPQNSADEHADEIAALFARLADDADVDDRPPRER